MFRRFGFQYWCSCLLCFGLLTLLSYATLAQDTRSLDTVMTGVATELAQRFPAVSGEVVKVEGPQVYLSVGARDNVVEGMQLTLVREGETLKRPTTGEVLGRVESELGIVTVEQVFERYAIATMTQAKSKDEIRSGDKVRISAGRLGLGILPPVVQTRQAVPQAELASMLQQALEATGRFRVVSRDQISIWLLKRGAFAEGVVPPELLPELAQSFQLSHVLLPLVKNLQGTTVLEAQVLIPTQPQAPVATASAIVPAAALARRAPEPPAAPPVQPVPVPAPSVAQPPVPPVPVPAPSIAQPPAQPVPAPAPSVAQPPAPATPPPSVQLESRLEGVFKNAPPSAQPGAIQWNLADTLTELQKLPVAVQGMDGADIDGDGQAEIVTMDAARISLYRLEGTRLVRLDTFESKRAGKLLSVQLLGLGTAKQLGIVVNRQVPDGTLDSFILTWQGQKLGMWQEHLDDILLAVDTDGDNVKDTIWGQPFDQDNFFRRGTVRQYTVTERSLEPRGNLSVPAPFRATGAVLAKLSDGGVPYLVFIDSGHRLQVFRGEEDLWRSKDGVGGGTTAADLERTIHRDKTRFSFYFEPIPAPVDVDGDGIEEVLVARNAEFLGGFIPNLNQFTGGDVVALRKERYGFTLTPVSPEFRGMVSGIAVLPGTPRTVLIAVTRNKGFLKGNETILYMSRLPSRTAASSTGAQ